MHLIGIANSVLLSTILLTSALFIFSEKNDSNPSFAPYPKQKELPKSPFAYSEDFFLETGEGVLGLNWAPPQMQLPDLRQEIIFFGKNARPDIKIGKASFYFALKGSQERKQIQEDARTYLVYQGSYTPKIQKPSTTNEPFGLHSSPIWGEAIADENQRKAPYVFSPDNQPTPLWFSVKNVHEQAVEIQVGMLDEKGSLVAAPYELRTFRLQPQELHKIHAGGWELDGQRVDTTLLVRQKARWVGPDLFLKMHGGAEFAHVVGKERIDFLEGETPYSCFVNVGDFLIWKQGRWKEPCKSDETHNFPLLVVKKIDEKIISFELWDPEGKGKTLLSLIRFKDHSGMPNLCQEFKFVGAKTWAQFIVECRTTERITLKPHDWLVLTNGEWKKIDSANQIDAYVNQNLTGPLFILEKMTKQNGRQVLIGHLFNTLRTEVQQVELSSSSNTSLANYYRHMPLVPPIQIKPADLGDSE